MNEPIPDRQLTYDEFLEFVRDNDGRYEFIDGVLIRWIDRHLDGSGCDTHGNKDVWTGKRARRPDVAVTCDQRDTGLEHPHALYFPKLIIAIDSTRRRVQRFRRSADGKFTVDFDQISGSLFIVPIGFMLDIDAMDTRARI